MAKLPFRSIPAPVADINSLQRTCEALREVVEMLTRQRGEENAWPVTAHELRLLGVISKSAVLPDAPQKPG